MADKSYYGYITNPFIDSLELSVRASNVLRNWGRVNTLEDFMALDKATVMRLPNAGVRTWGEIKRMQDYLRRDPSIETMAALQDAMAGRTYRAASVNALFDTSSDEPSQVGPAKPHDTTLREKAALAALQGLLANPQTLAYLATQGEVGLDIHNTWLVRRARQIADAFVAALEGKSDG